MKKSDKDNVYKAYNEIADWFDNHRSKDLSLERYYLEYAKEHLPPGGKVLDFGCGTGEPIAKFFIEHGYDVTGIDASEEMIRFCKQRFSNAKWLLIDMRSLQLADTFDLVIAWHSLFHLPHADQRYTLPTLGSLVKPSGLLLFTSGAKYSEIWSNNGGCELYHASLSLDEYHTILQKNGFEVLINQVEDPSCGDATTWVARQNAKP